MVWSFEQFFVVVVAGVGNIVKITATAAHKLGTMHIGILICMRDNDTAWTMLPEKSINSRMDTTDNTHAKQSTNIM